MKTILTLVVVLVGFVGNAQDRGNVYRLTYEQANKLKKMYDSIYDFERIENEFLTIINQYRRENNLTVAIFREDYTINFNFKITARKILGI